MRGRDAQLVGVVAVVTALLSLTVGLSPTGSTVVDAVLVAAATLFVVWSAASAPWWMGVVAAGVATAFAPSVLWMMLGVLALFGGLAVGGTRRSLPWSRALVAGAATVVFTHLGNTRFFGFTALLAVVTLTALAITGVARRPRGERRTLWIVLGGTAGALVLSLLGFGLAAASARPDIEEANRSAREALRLLGSGDVDGASAAFSRTADLFDAGNDDLGALWAQPARLVPVVAQHRRAATELVQAASTGSRELARQLALIDYDSLRVVDGRIDLEAVRGLEAPVTSLQATLDGLIADVAGATDPWLIDELDDRLVELQTDLVSRQDEVANAVAAVRQAPAMLGGEGPRVYFLAFTTPSESRGLGGFMGNWAELTFDDGELEVTGFGRTRDLAEGGSEMKTLVAPDESFRNLYASPLWGTTAGDEVHPEAWSNITVSPHFPSVGGLVAQLYPQSGGNELDGVFAMDVYTLAELMKITGPVTLPNGTELDSANTVDYLLREQYLTDANAERIDNLEYVAQSVTDRLLTSTLPSPPELGDRFGPLARAGRLVAWAVRPEEQDVFRRVRLTGEIPSRDGGDGVMVALNNASANKIDVFLEGTAAYDVKVNRGLGRVDGTLTVRLRNEAPASGLPDYLIGNLVDLPLGTNRIQLLLYSALPVTSFKVDGVDAGFQRHTEQGYAVTVAILDIPPGEEIVVQLGVGGGIDPAAEYRLVTREPAAVKPFPLEVTVDLNNTDPAPEVAP